MNATLPSLLGAAVLAALPLAPLPTTTAPVQEDDAVAAAGGLLPAATQAIDIPVERDLSLADLVDSLADATGLRFVVSSSTRQFLNDTPCGLLSGGTVQPGEVYPFVESILKRHRVVMERLAGQDVPVAALYWLDGGRDSNSLGWSSVAADSIDAVREHGSLLVQSTLDVTPSDARMLTNSTRMLMRDTNYQNILAINNSTVLLRGTGSEVAALIDMFREASKNEQAYYEAQRAASEAAQQGAAGGGGR